MHQFYSKEIDSLMAEAIENLKKLDPFDHWHVKPQFGLKPGDDEDNIFWLEYKGETQHAHHAMDIATAFIVGFLAAKGEKWR